jgi:hypothetical protein
MEGGATSDMSISLSVNPAAMAGVKGSKKVLPQV